MENYGYCLEDNIPKLYLEVEDYKKVRYDFWSLVSYLFVHNYMKNIYDWCDAHNVQATGHVMMEESIFSQMTSTAGVMPFYEYEHIPGIDWLRQSDSFSCYSKTGWFCSLSAWQEESLDRILCALWLGCFF